jgi:hypothetical protein
MALLFTLSVGAILSILAVSLIGLYFGDYHSQRMQQQAIAAYWNARSDVERYCDARQLPDKGTYTEFDCQVSQENRDLVFTGHSGAMSRRIKLLGGDPAQRVELP